MKIFLKSIMLIIILSSLIGCSNKVSVENDVIVQESKEEENHDDDLLIKQNITREEIDQSYDGRSSLIYIDQEEKDFVTEDFSIENGIFKGKLVIFEPMDKNKKLSFLLNNKMHSVKINGIDSDTHELKLKKGKNVIDIETQNIPEGTNTADIYISPDKDIDKDIMMVQSFFIINNSEKGSIDKTNSMTNIKYDVLNEKTRGQLTFFASKDTREQMNEIDNNTVKVKAGEELTIPFISDSDIWSESNIFIVLCDGEPLGNDDGYLFKLNVNEKDKLLYSEFNVKVPINIGTYKINIVSISNPYSNNSMERIVATSQSFVLEVS